MLLKLARLSLGRSLPDSKENNTVLHALELLNSKQHQELLQEFIRDNQARVLPYLWRESVVRTVMTRSDMRVAALLAIANALHQVGEACKSHELIIICDKALYISIISPLYAMIFYFYLPHL